MFVRNASFNEKLILKTKEKLPDKTKTTWVIDIHIATDLVMGMIELLPNLQCCQKITLLMALLSKYRKVYKRIWTKITKKDERHAQQRERIHTCIHVDEYASAICAKLQKDFSKAVQKSYPFFGDFPIQVIEEPPTTSNIVHGRGRDYRFNSALALSNIFPSTKPIEVARMVMDNFPPSQLVEKVEAVEPGVVNIYLNRQEIGHRIGDIFRNGVQTTLPKIRKRKVVVDFSSPNIAQHMHVGHLRSTIIGDSICRLLELMNFDVLRLNHIGDWGDRLGMLIAHLRDKLPSYLSEALPTSDLWDFYTESKKRFDLDKDFKRRACDCAVKLQDSDSDIHKAWELICDVSRKDFNRIYQRLNVSIVERGESFYQTRMIALSEQLEAQCKLQDYNRRKILFATGFKTPLTVVKSDSGFTYATSDLAALKQRLDEEQADWIIYVVDAGQSEHLETVFSTGRDLGFYDPKEKRVQHVGFELSKDRKKLKTRSLEAIRLTELLDEGVKRSKAKMEAKRAAKSCIYENIPDKEFEQTYQAVAYSCIKYSDLSQNRNSDYVFSFEKMFEDSGNTAVYLLDTYARIRSIFRTAGVSREHLLEYLYENNGSLPLNYDAEFTLSKQILKISDCILQVLDTLFMDKLCDYVYELATNFNHFYNERVYIIQEGNFHLYDNQLILCKVTGDIMSLCFNILGLHVVEKN